MKEEANEYTVDYFIAKFEGIPEEQWTVGICLDTSGRRCAYGHCGLQRLEIEGSREAMALTSVFGRWDSVTRTNDGSATNPYRHLPTPKERILAALRDIKAGQSKELNRV